MSVSAGIRVDPLSCWIRNLIPIADLVLLYMYIMIDFKFSPDRRKIRKQCQMLSSKKFDLKRNFAAGVYLSEAPFPRMTPYSPPHTLYTCILYTSVGDLEPDLRIRMFLGLPDPDPLVRGTDPDPSLFS